MALFAPGEDDESIDDVSSVKSAGLEFGVSAFSLSKYLCLVLTLYCIAVSALSNQAIGSQYYVLYNAPDNLLDVLCLVYVLVI